MIVDLSTLHAAQAAVAATSARAALIFKHSTRCGTSAYAWSQYEAFARDNADADVDYLRILVVENRPVSLGIADELGVAHESPQLILVSGGRAVWHTSHYGIRPAAIREALDAAGVGFGH